jgi:hypothetical protein
MIIDDTDLINFINERGPETALAEIEKDAAIAKVQLDSATRRNEWLASVGVDPDPYYENERKDALERIARAVRARHYCEQLS